MKSNEASLFVFIACIIIGVLISLNINFNRTNNRIFLTTKQYQDAYHERTKLRNDILNLQNNYDELYKKLRKFQDSDESSSITKELHDELDKNKMILGQMDVEGPGILITLKDISNDLYYNYEDPFLIDKIIHNYDMVYVINDIRNAGAEAISINGQRVTDRSEVICDGPLLKINGIKIAAPFYVSAIGNKEVLKNYMLNGENYLKHLINREINVEVKESDDIKIQGYYHDLKKKFISAAKEK